MPPTLVFDSEALSALASFDKGMAEVLTAALRNSLGRLAQHRADRGHDRLRGAGVAVRHVIESIPVVDIDTRIAARAGGLRTTAHAVRRKSRDLTVSAVIASVAIETVPSVVLTSDPSDFALLVEGHDIVVSETRQRVAASREDAPASCRWHSQDGRCRSSHQQQRMVTRCTSRALH